MDKLSKDASAAIKAGMTYGQYMAMKHPVRIIPHKKPEAPKQETPKREISPEIIEHVCECCGMVFHRKDRRGQRFCSINCKRRYYVLHRGENTMTLKACGICGAEFQAESSKSKYCSDRCRKLAQEECMKRFNERMMGVDRDELEI